MNTEYKWTEVYWKGAQGAQQINEIGRILCTRPRSGIKILNALPKAV
jgi:hypothetical protein